MKNYSVFVGLDGVGDACIYLAELNKDNDTNGRYMSQEKLEELIVPVIENYLDTRKK